MLIVAVEQPCYAMVHSSFSCDAIRHILSANLLFEIHFLNLAFSVYFRGVFNAQKETLNTLFVLTAGLKEMKFDEYPHLFSLLFAKEKNIASTHSHISESICILRYKNSLSSGTS